jgi:hypothetical protein
MRRTVVESKIVVAYSQAIRPSESNVQIVAEKMKNLLSPGDALTKLFARVLGRSLASVLPGQRNYARRFAALANSLVSVFVSPTIAFIDFNVTSSCGGRWLNPKLWWHTRGRFDLLSLMFR